MRINSSRQVVGVEMICETAGIGVPSSNRPFVVLAFGMRLRSAVATGSMGTAAGFGTFGQSEGWWPQRTEKSPVRSKSEGTSCWIEEGFFSRRHSCDQKKKVFFLSAL